MPISYIGILGKVLKESKQSFTIVLNLLSHIIQLPIARMYFIITCTYGCINLKGCFKNRTRSKAFKQYIIGPRFLPLQILIFFGKSLVNF